MDEIKEIVIVKLEIWRDTLESKGFTLYRLKTKSMSSAKKKKKLKCMECKFSNNNISMDDVIMRLEDQSSKDKIIYISWIGCIKKGED